MPSLNAPSPAILAKKMAWGISILRLSPLDSLENHRCDWNKIVSRAIAEVHEQLQLVSETAANVAALFGYQD